MNRLTPLATQPHYDDDLIDFSRLLNAISRYKWSILGLALVIALISGLMVYSMEPVYRASASIVLESQDANVVAVEEVYAVDTDAYYYMETQFEILKSRDLAERVVRKLQLHKNPFFLPTEDETEDPWYSIIIAFLLPAREQEPPVQLSEEELEEQAIQRVTGIVASGFTVEPVEYSYVAYLHFESTNPGLAALIVNGMAEEFINGNMEVRQSGTLQATDWLSERLEDLKQKLRESELALQDFRDREGLVNVEGVTGLGGSELKLLSRRLEDARKTRIEAQNIKDDVQDMGGASTDELMAVPAVQEHPVIRDLRRVKSSAERKVAELAKRYGVKHPKMISALSDLSTASGDLAKEVRKVVSGINREYEIALRTEQQLQATWEASKSEVQDFNRKEFRLQELQRDVETNRDLHDIFFSRIKNVSETGGFERPHARIVDRALVPGSPVRPNKRRSITFAFILGVILGCAIAILLDILDNTIKSPDDVQAKLGVPLLGVIPKMKLDSNDHFEQFWDNPQSHYAEAMRTIRTGVVLSGLDDPAKIIVVTSTVPGEGKSTTALNLGAALAQMESTLVIGGDLRRPSLARKCGLNANHKGLSHFVSGDAELDDCIEYLAEKQIHVMPAGVIPPNPLEMISSRKFVAALDILKQRFDRIVIDSAPVQAVSDALILSSYADSIIYVIKSDSTSAILVEKGLSGMIASNKPVTGVVLNQYDPKSAGKHYRNYDSGYGDYYQSRAPV